MLRHEPGRPSIIPGALTLLGHQTVRYHFHTINGEREPDLDGTELPTLEAARKMAVVFSAHSLADHPQLLWQSGDFRVEVTDEENRLLFTISTQVYDAPASSKRARPA